MTESQPRKEDAATQQIAREAREQLVQMFLIGNKKLFSRTIYYPSNEAMDHIILSAIERANKELAEVADRSSVENLQLRRAAQQPQRSEQEWKVSEYDNCNRCKMITRDGKTTITEGWSVHYKNDLWKVADAHNSALVAEREKAVANYVIAQTSGEPNAPSEGAQPQPSKTSPLGERSEQQEWTPEYVSKMFEANFVGDTVKAICDAHNAALAAAWKEHDDVADALANFSETIKQLGARNQQLNIDHEITKRSRESWQQIAGQAQELLAAERQLRDEARAQREWLIKECGRIGVTVNVQIGAPITEAYRLVNTERQRREQAEHERDGLKDANRGLYIESNERYHQLAAERQRREHAEHWLGEILAVIHCDGGHYQSEHGIEKATNDAITKRTALIQKIDDLETQLLSAQAAIAEVEAHNIAGTISPEALAKHDADLVAPYEAHESERKTVHEWLNDAYVTIEENGKPICLLRRLRIAIDKLTEYEKH